MLVHVLLRPEFPPGLPLKPGRDEPLLPGRGPPLLDLPPPGRAPPPVRPRPWKPVRPGPEDGGLGPPGRGTPLDVNAARPPAGGLGEVREGGTPSRRGGKAGFSPERPSGLGVKGRPVPWGGLRRSPLNPPVAGFPGRGVKRCSDPCAPEGRSPRGLNGFRGSNPAPSARREPLGNAGRSKRGLSVPPVAGRSRKGR